MKKGRFHEKPLTISCNAIMRVLIKTLLFQKKIYYQNQLLKRRDHMADSHTEHCSCCHGNCGGTTPTYNKPQGNSSALATEHLENHVLTEVETSTEDVLSMMQKGEL